MRPVNVKMLWHVSIEHGDIGPMSVLLLYLSNEHGGAIICVK